MKNEKLIAAGRAILKRLLSVCTEGNHQMFKRMYSNGNLDLTIDQAVDEMDPDKIDHAITQAERTIEKLGIEEPICKHDWILTGEGRWDYTCSKCGKNE